MRRSSISFLAVLAVLGLAMACSTGRSDMDIATEVKAKMFSDPQLKTSTIDVVAKNGEVTLSGEAPSEAARYEAFKLANSTPGVKKVNDQMTVKVAEVAPPPEPEPAAAPPPAPVKKPSKKVTHTAPREEPPAPAAPPQNSAAAPTTSPPPPPPQPKQVEIPGGTSVSVRMIDSIDSSVNHPGEVFRASLDAPIVVDNEIVVPSGTDVFVKLVESHSAGKIAGRSELKLELVRMQFQGKSYVLQSSDYEQTGGSRGKSTAKRVGAATAIGAAIGAIAGGGKGAAIGAGIGAAGGTGIQVATRGEQVRIPSETRIDFRLEQPVEVSYFPEKNRSKR